MERTERSREFQVDGAAVVVAVDVAGTSIQLSNFLKLLGRLSFDDQPTDTCIHDIVYTYLQTWTDPYEIWCTMSWMNLPRSKILPHLN